MTDQELKDLVASLAVASRETDLIVKETALQMKEGFQRLTLQMEDTDRKMKETDLQMKETALQMKETDRKMQETALQMKETDLQMKETDRKWKESSEKWDKMSDKWDSINTQVNGINDNIGHHAEQFFQDIFSETLTFAGKKYDIMHPNLICKGKNELGEFDAGEFDIVLVNGKNVAIIEVKNRIKQRFVKDLVEVKVDRFRKFMPEYSDKKLYLGIAGFSFSKAVIEKAKQYGIAIIRQVGQSIEMETKNLKAY